MLELSPGREIGGYYIGCAKQYQLTYFCVYLLCLSLHPRLVCYFLHVTAAFSALPSLLIEASGPDETPLPLTVLDTLTRTGALHEVSGVLWPRSVRVGIHELAEAADAGTMIRLVQRAGLEGIWNGSGIPVELVGGSSADPTLKWRGWMNWNWFDSVNKPDNDKKEKTQRWAYTLLCPTDAAFARVNLTRLLDDREALIALVRQHIVPVPIVDSGSGKGEKGKDGVEIMTPGGESWADRALGWFVKPERGVENLLNGEHVDKFSHRRLSSGIDSVRSAASPLEPDAETPLPLKSASNQFGTLLTPRSAYGDVVFEHTGDRGWAVGVKGADIWAHVTAWGRTVGVGESTEGFFATLADVPVGGGVVQIDHVLEPYTPAWWREWGPALGVGAAGVAGIALMFAAIVWVWRRDVQEATYEPLDGGEDE